ncbi:MAG: hypothetical protein Q8L46_01300 [candidate division WWE3 bacterium]|nr:hypothetical protein [candidate division WWE3 bacterium]
MNQKGFVNIILIVVVVVLVGITGYFVLVKKSGPITQQQTPTPSATSGSENYSTEPFAECVECENGKTWNNKPCCTDSFEKDCAFKNGTIRWSDLHPVFTVLKGCFQKAPEAGKECASGNDCLSGVCDLESAIKSNRCSLIKKELTGGKNQYYGQEFYTASYFCNTINPGVCTETIPNRVNPGGVNHTFEMDNKILIETLESGPIF